LRYWIWFWLTLACNSTVDETPPPLFALSGVVAPHQAFTAQANGDWWFSQGEQLHRAMPGEEPHPIDGIGLPPGIRRFIAPTSNHLFVHVHGRGLYRGPLSGGELTPIHTGLDNPLLAMLDAETTPVPLALHEADGVLWLAAAGGLFSSTDQGTSWSLAGTGASGSVNVLFTDVAIQGDTLLASAMLPSSLIPKDYQGLLQGTVFRSDNGGQTWTDITSDLPSQLVSSVTYQGDQWFVGTLDQGVFALEGTSWQSIPNAPSDVVALDGDAESLHVGSASRGVWQHIDGSWHQAGTGASRDVLHGMAMMADGSLLALNPSAAWHDAPASAGGRVHIALSFHVNYYHSYRGDQPTDDGFGQDIDVIRNTLDWLDAHPTVHGDWDSDNAFTTDDWMLTHSPDILDRIRARVADGRDQVRLMSWNNGAMASMTRPEFDVAMERAKTSNADAFGAWVPGVQPQENMFTPDHIGWYRAHEIDWITLFYAANGFTAARLDVTLEGPALYNPVTLEAPDGNTMTWMPVYHHADMMEHGGLAGWAQQLHDSMQGDSLLVIHFDADGESWENFSSELDAAVELDFVTFTNIGTYIDSHSPVDQVSLPGDLADGTGDGFQSWAEKDWNHRLFTEVIRAREAAMLAEAIAPDDPDVQTKLNAALEPRLLALSTTNYGLAMPTLHEDRVASGAHQAADAVSLAQQALELAEALHPVPAGTLDILNLRDASGPALLEFDLPIGDWGGPEGLRIANESDEPQPVEIAAVNEDIVSVQVVATVEAQQRLTWTWSYTAGASHNPMGTLADADAPDASALHPAFVDWKGTRSEATSTGESTFASETGLSAHRVGIGSLPTAGELGDVVRTQTQIQGLPGTVLSVDAQLPDVGLDVGLESVVLSPLVCDGIATELTWKTYADTIRTRPVRTPVATWNGQSADGWIAVRCADEVLSVSHRVTERTSMAFLPLSAEGDHTLLAPLGTLYGPSPWHDGRRTGGHGMGELVTSVVGSQFAPAAPDWSGRAVHYRLLIGDDLAPDILELFAHPPHVRVGPR